MTQAILYTITFIALFGTFVLMGLSTAIRKLSDQAVFQECIKMGKRFFYRPFHSIFFPRNSNDALFFVIIAALNITRFGYAACATLLLLQSVIAESLPLLCLGIIILVAIHILIGDYLPRYIASKQTSYFFRFCAPLASPYLFLAFPFAYIFLRIPRSFSERAYSEQFLDRAESKAEQEVLDIVREAKLTTLDPHEKHLIDSVLSFRNRIVREVMVPRVDVFSLSEDTKIRDATKLLEEEGYSRVPVFSETVDSIVGVLMYKDLVHQYALSAESQDPQVLDAPISSIQKPALYTPETKKISLLLQEFRRKQVHLAIVVDEYGGTEGIVTIEDILEEIVGEIADEYDIEEELFVTLPDGSWVVDARMSINDAEQQLSIKIPQTGDYDTIGGYIFHRTGAIPSKGFVIHHEEFELEILRSNDRCVEKVRIRPILKSS